MSFAAPDYRPLVFEMSDSSENHANSGFIAEIDGILVFYRASRLHDSPNSGVEGQFNPVCKGKKGVGCQYCVCEVEVKPLRLIHGLLKRINPAGLPRADSDQLAVEDQGNPVALDVLDRFVGKNQIALLRRRWGHVGHRGQVIGGFGLVVGFLQQHAVEQAPVFHLPEIS